MEVIGLLSLFFKEEVPQLSLPGKKHAGKMLNFVISCMHPSLPESLARLTCIEAIHPFVKPG